MSMISSFHHLTVSTDGAQEDFDSCTKTLGLHSVKRTVLFDGVIPVCHLHCGPPDGDASSIIITFPFRKPGVPWPARHQSVAHHPAGDPQRSRRNPGGPADCARVDGS